MIEMFIFVSSIIALIWSFYIRFIKEDWYLLENKYLIIATSVLVLIPTLFQVIYILVVYKSWRQFYNSEPSNLAGITTTVLALAMFFLFFKIIKEIMDRL